MIHLMQVAQRIEDIGEAAMGVDLFLFTLPADVSNAVMIRPPLTGDKTDPEQPDVYSSEFLVVVRHGDVELGFAKAQTIANALTLNREMLGEVWIIECRPRTRPTPFPRNEGGTIEWGVPFVISWGEQPA